MMPSGGLEQKLRRLASPGLPGAGLDVSPTGLAAFLPQAAGMEKAKQGLGKGGGVGGLKGQAGPTGGFAKRGVGTVDDWGSGRHGLQHGHAEAFAARWDDVGEGMLIVCR